MLLIKSSDEVLIVKDVKEATPDAEARLDEVLVLSRSCLNTLITYEINARLKNDLN